MTPAEALKKIKKNIKREWKLAFFSVLICGLVVHFKVFAGDFPNHDGLSSMYFDQNMITSGRWFLMIACGISSYFTLPWLIGIFSLIFLGIGCAALIDFLEIKDDISVVLTSCMLVVFPALSSTYAYIFTADGYMMALGLVFLAVAFTGKRKWGFLPGAVCLAFSMGTYQSYLAFAILLSIYGCIMILMTDQSFRDKLSQMLHYLYMGILGVGLYYLLLQVLLKIQGKVLDTYQGINNMASAGGSSVSGMLSQIYRDFLAFTVRGNVLYNNMLSFLALALLGLVFIVLFIRLAMQRGYWKKWYFYGILLLVLLFVPIAANVILIISPEVTYHLLMRYQWVLLPILLYAFCVRYGFLQTEIMGIKKNRGIVTLQWLACLSMLILVIHYGVTDNIAYFNLEKKYEKTYAYCLRLVDRMEQTEGYYTGIPVAMVGVQGSDVMPETDITGDVTSNMIGMTGDYLVYTDTNYQAFLKNYLGVTINLVPDEEMERIYHSEEYRALNSFPGEGSMKVVDGVLYIKTENYE